MELILHGVKITNPKPDAADKLALSCLLRRHHNVYTQHLAFAVKVVSHYRRWKHEVVAWLFLGWVRWKTRHEGR